MAHGIGWMATAVLIVGLGGMAGCGQPVAAPTPDKPSTSKSAEPAAVKPAAPEPKTVVVPVAAAAKSAEAQVMEWIRLLIAKLEAKDYKWVYESALPPAEAKALHAAHSLDEFVREFADKGADQALLTALKTVKEEDIEFQGTGGDKAVVAWKDSWKKQIDLIFLRVDGQWYLGR